MNTRKKCIRGLGSFRVGIKIDNLLSIGNRERGCLRVWWRRRELNPRPKTFFCWFYMRIHMT